MGNQYFKHTYDSNNNESELYRQAVDEICEMIGVDFKYMSKTLVKPDYIFGEDTLKEFHDHRVVTFMIENYEQYDGAGDMFSKFGFEIDNKLILIIEKQRFKTYTDLDKPEIDDLIYHENSQKIFKISHIDYDGGFYQMNGGRDRFRITCDLFTPSHEFFETNIEDIDQLSDENDSNNDNEKSQFNQEVEDILDLKESDIFDNL